MPIAVLALALGPLERGMGEVYVPAVSGMTVAAVILLGIGIARARA